MSTPVLIAIVAGIVLLVILVIVIIVVAVSNSKKKKKAAQTASRPAAGPPPRSARPAGPGPSAPARPAGPRPAAPARPAGPRPAASARPAAPAQYADQAQKDTVMLWEDSAESRLILQDISDPARRFETVLRGRILVGRDGSQCQIVLNEPTVARKQCEIYRQGSEIMLRNLSTSNITKVDDQRVNGECPLHHGNVITMGRMRFRVEVR